MDIRELQRKEERSHIWQHTDTHSHTVDSEHKQTKAITQYIYYILNKFINNVVYINTIINIKFIQFSNTTWIQGYSERMMGQPRPKYIFNKCGANIYFFTLQRFGPSPSLHFKSEQY